MRSGAEGMHVLPVHAPAARETVRATRCATQYVTR
jgi:hypothetical protein